MNNMNNIVLFITLFCILQAKMVFYQRLNVIIIKFETVWPQTSFAEETLKTDFEENDWPILLRICQKKRNELG